MIYMLVDLEGESHPPQSPSSKDSPYSICGRNSKEFVIPQAVSENRVSLNRYSNSFSFPVETFML